MAAREIRKLGKRHEQQVVEKRVFIATPAYDGKVYTDYAVALAETCQMATLCNIGIVASVMGNGAFIEIARNTFVKRFLDSDCTHLFFIDADLKWEPRAFVGLVNADRPVSAGIYRRRQDPEDYPVHYLEDKDNPGLTFTDGGWIPCDRVATGFLCIRRDVIEAMVAEAEKWELRDVGVIPALFYTKQVAQEDKEGLGFVGEDFAFCDDYMDKFKHRFGDQPIMAWPDFDFRHAGFEGNWLRFINREIAEYERQQKEAAA